MSTTASTPSELFIAIDTTLRNQTAPNSITPLTHSDLLYNMVEVLSGNTYTTGGTYSSGTTTYTNNVGESFNVSGFNDGSINYSNVLFVDALSGDDSTAIVGRFDKPFQTRAQAAVIANGLTRNSTNKVLIHIRNGLYYNNLNMMDFVDYYCEPGVVFSYGVISDVLYGACTSNLFGYAKLIDTTIDVFNGSTCTFEFDTMNNNNHAMRFISETESNVIIKCNSIYTTTLGSGFGITLRNACNLTMHVAKSIEAIHSVFRFRLNTGLVIINCPKIYLGAGNIYGGNYKQAIYCTDSTSSGTIIVNGDIESRDPVNYGGIGSLVLTYADAHPKITINGNIKGGPIKALDGNTASDGTFEINGNISSDNDFTLWGHGNGQLLFKNSLISNSGISATSKLMSVNGTASTIIYFKDCFMYNGRIDSGLIDVNGTCNLVIDGCLGETLGTLGETVTSVGGAPLVRFHNSRFNKANNINITDLYSPTGFILDTNVIVPKI